MLTKEKILERENILVAALIGNDVFVLESLLHDDILINNSEGHTHTKAIYMDEVRSGVLRISEYRASEDVVNIIDDVAVVSLSAYIEGTMAGNTISLDLKVMRVWKEFGEGLKIVGMSEVVRNL